LSAKAGPRTTMQGDDAGCDAVVQRSSTRRRPARRRQRCRLHRHQQVTSTTSSFQSSARTCHSCRQRRPSARRAKVAAVRAARRRPCSSRRTTTGTTFHVSPTRCVVDLPTSRRHQYHLSSVADHVHLTFNSLYRPHVIIATTVFLFPFNNACCFSN